MTDHDLEGLKQFVRDELASLAAAIGRLEAALKGDAQLGVTGVVDRITRVEDLAASAHRRIDHYDREAPDARLHQVENEVGVLVAWRTRVLAAAAAVAVVVSTVIPLILDALEKGA
ncbi:MAG: hypothetical protein WC977_07940 [Anaerovoracaceae bacterium]